MHEALCRGLPALVSAEAGVAERYPSDLRALLLPNPDDVTDLVDRLRHWRKSSEVFRAAVLPLSNALRKYSWNTMAERIVQIVETAA